ncbi:helix-turn-helix domain-containing protein [bacterium D16-76]|nr:helix-turn-helix domain-containing protein [bacterium D16-76]
MNSKEFQRLLSKAISGDNDALADIAVLYMPLINRYSYIDGKLDEDLRQNILLELVQSISRFKI